MCVTTSSDTRVFAARGSSAVDWQRCVCKSGYDADRVSVWFCDEQWSSLHKFLHLLELHHPAQPDRALSSLHHVSAYGTSFFGFGHKRSFCVNLCGLFVCLQVRSDPHSSQPVYWLGSGDVLAAGWQTRPGQEHLTERGAWPSGIPA